MLLLQYSDVSVPQILLDQWPHILLYLSHSLPQIQFQVSLCLTNTFYLLRSLLKESPIQQSLHLFRNCISLTHSIFSSLSSIPSLNQMINHYIHFFVLFFTSQVPLIFNTHLDKLTLIILNFLSTWYLHPCNWNWL